MLSDKLFLFIFATVVVNLTAAQYGELPQPIIVDLTEEEAYSSLQPYFNAVNGFINATFQPFSALEELLRPVLEDNEDIFNFLQNMWQEILNIQSGVIACIVFGVLFIVVLLFGAILTCCCRCYCKKCGGDMRQSRRRSKSNWRRGYFFGLLFVSIMIFCSAVVLGVVNDNTNQEAQELPTSVFNILQNAVNYVGNIQPQIDSLLSAFDLFTEKILSDVQRVNDSLGAEILSDLTDIQAPVFDKISDLLVVLNESDEHLIDYNDIRTQLVNDLTRYRTSMTNFRDNAMTALGLTSACLSACINAQMEISNFLPDVITLNDVRGKLIFFDNYKMTCAVVLSQIRTNATRDMSEALATAISPSFISNLTSEFNESLSSAGDVINSEIDNLNALDDIQGLVETWQMESRNILNTYKENYEVYRWIVGILITLIIIVIVTCYLVGLLFGQFFTSSDTIPTKRGRCSNWMGLLVMSGSGLSFIFTWLLMLLCIILFIIGGFIERYGCQTLKPPYELPQVIDRYNIVNTNDLDVNLVNLLNGCQANEGIITALQAENLLNLDQIRNETFDGITTPDISVDFQFVPEYASNSILQCLQQLIDDTRVDHISNDYTGSGALPDNNANIGRIAALSANPALTQQQRRIIDDLAEDLRSIQAQIDSETSTWQAVMAAEDDFSRASDQIRVLSRELLVELPGTSSLVQTELPNIVENNTQEFVSDLLVGGDDFFLWISEQILNNLGKCLPFYVSYRDFVNLTCDNLINLLNGFWFALGWASVFLAFGIILALKLAKFYRRMDETDIEAEKLQRYSVELVGISEAAAKVARKSPKRSSRIAPLNF